MAERDPEHEALRAFWLELSGDFFAEPGELEYGDFLDLGMKYGLIEATPWNDVDHAHIEGEEGDMVYISTVKEGADG